MAFLDTIFQSTITLWLEASDLVGLKHGDDVLSWPSKNNALVATGAAGVTGKYQENQLNGYPTILFDALRQLEHVAWRGRCWLHIRTLQAARQTSGGCRRDDRWRWICTEPDVGPTDERS
jgi:hypothetical protein